MTSNRPGPHAPGPDRRWRLTSRRASTTHVDIDNTRRTESVQIISKPDVAKTLRATCHSRLRCPLLTLEKHSIAPLANLTLLIGVGKLSKGRISTSFAAQTPPASGDAKPQAVVTCVCGRGRAAPPSPRVTRTGSRCRRPTKSAPSARAPRRRGPCVAPALPGRWSRA